MQNTKIIDGYPFIRYKKETYTPAEMQKRSQDFYTWMDQRRTARDFSKKPVPREVIENIILTASSAPSGAHKQPWTFCIVSNAQIKKEIRLAAEKEERESYENRMSDEWLDDLRPLGTDWQKPFLEIAPYLIIIFSRSYETTDNGKKHQNYYVKESTGIT